MTHKGLIFGFTCMFLGFVLIATGTLLGPHGGAVATPTVATPTASPTVAATPAPNKVYRGDIYSLYACGPSTVTEVVVYQCPQDQPIAPGATTMQEDAPLFWCLEDGNKDCGPTPIYRHQGVTCIEYETTPVCEYPDGLRVALGRRAK